MSMWDDLFGHGLRRAFGRGALKALSGGGAAARREEASVVNQFARTTFRLFKNNCLPLPWIKQRADLDASIEGARADLMRSWNAYQESLKSRRTLAQADSDWLQVLSAFRRHVADLNRRIAAYNLKAPSAKFRRPPVDAEREINTVKDLR
ncbi:MAG TPA: hypothetical protein VFS10_19045 [Pyrinomonadaceae bacterium]|nr:hypothetical protein [Pyrinomonadaceae bacterium]